MFFTVTFTLLIVSIAFAQTGSGYDLTWSTIDGGGGTATGSDYAVAGTFGQPDAGVMSGNAYTLSGGFWNGPTILAHFRIYLPLVLK